MLSSILLALAMMIPMADPGYACWVKTVVPAEVYNFSGVGYGEDFYGQMEWQVVGVCCLQSQFVFDFKTASSDGDLNNNPTRPYLLVGEWSIVCDGDQICSNGTISYGPWEFGKPYLTDGAFLLDNIQNPAGQGWIWPINNCIRCDCYCEIVWSVHTLGHNGYEYESVLMCNGQPLTTRISCNDEPCVP